MVSFSVRPVRNVLLQQIFFSLFYNTFMLLIGCSGMSVISGQEKGWKNENTAALCEIRSSSYNDTRVCGHRMFGAFYADATDG